MLDIDETALSEGRVAERTYKLANPFYFVP